MQIKCEKCYAVSDAAMPETYLEGGVELTFLRCPSCGEVYSAKCGHVYIAVNEDEVPAAILENASDLLDRLINEIRGDVRAENGDHMEIEDSPEEIMEIRRRALSYLDSMDPELRSFCIDVMTMCMVGEALISD